MASTRAWSARAFQSAIAGQSFFVGQCAWLWRPQCIRFRSFATEPSSSKSSSSDTSDASSQRSKSTSTSADSPARNVEPATSTESSSMPPGWEDDPNYNISAFSQLPHKHFGFNQHMLINAEFKEALRQVLWQFRAPIRYAFAYGSGVFGQTSDNTSEESKPSPHPNPPEAVTKWQNSGGKIIDFIFGVTYTQHWHSLNLQQHRDHYSGLRSLGSGIVSRVQDQIGAGAYFNPYIVVNGIMIKYGVVNLDTLYRDLSEWDTLYFAGRLQKPVKILRDDPRLRLANQVNLISALRTALLMLPADFTERELYLKIAGLSYLGDPRMALNAESPRKVANIVDSQMANFRQLYLPLIDDLPNVVFNDPATSREGWTTNEDLDCHIQQDMDTTKRGNMVRRLPKAFRGKLYNVFKGVFQVPEKEFEGILDETKDESTFSKSVGGDFDRRIASRPDLNKMVSDVVRQTVTWPTISQSVKGAFTAGFRRGWKYFSEKRAKGKKLRQTPSIPEKEKSKDDDDDHELKKDDKAA